MLTFPLFPLLAVALFGAQGTLDRGRTIEGEYESFQFDGAVHRTLRLERDGTAELSTDTWLRRGDDARPGLLDYKYGRIAEMARHRVAHHTGRWSERDGRIALRLDRLDTDEPGTYRSNLRLERRDGDLAARGDNDLYGTEEIRFRPFDDDDRSREREDGRRGPGEEAARRSRYGALSVDHADFRPIDTVEYSNAFGRVHVKLRAGDRKMNLHGKIEGKGDRVRFVINGKDGVEGTLTLWMQEGSVVGIRGRGDDHGRPFEIVESRTKGR